MEKTSYYKRLDRLEEAYLAKIEAREALIKERKTRRKAKKQRIFFCRYFAF